MSKKAKIITISVSVSVVVILTVCLLLVFLFKPQKATNVQVLTTAQHIYVKSDLAEGERTYRFKFASEGEVKEFDSPSHLFEITELLWQGQLKFGESYKVSVAYVEPTGVLAGDYGSEVLFTPSITLESPELSVNEQMLSWEEVRGADFYYLYYYLGQEQVKVKVTGTSFDLRTITGGDRSYYVTSASDHFYFIESGSSNSLQVRSEHELASFSNASFSLGDFSITVYSPERVLGIVLNDVTASRVYEITKYEQTFVSNRYQIKFSIQSIYLPGKTFTVQPKTDSFNSYSGEATEVVIL